MKIESRWEGGSAVIASRIALDYSEFARVWQTVSVRGWVAARQESAAGNLQSPLFRLAISANGARK
jgi:hypothetical protein